MTPDKSEAQQLADALERFHAYAPACATQDRARLDQAIALLRRWPDGEPVGWWYPSAPPGYYAPTFRLGKAPPEPFTAAEATARNWMPLYTAPPDQPERIAAPPRLWLWRNWVDGRPEYLAFDNPYPLFMDSDDPQTLGEPCGYAIVKPSRRGRPDVSDEDAAKRIKSDAERIAALEQALDVADQTLGEVANRLNAKIAALESALEQAREALEYGLPAMREEWGHYKVDCVGKSAISKAEIALRAIGEAR